MESGKGKSTRAMAFKDFLISFCLIFSLQFEASSASSGPLSTESRKHFVLVHGACHGAWSWYKIMALLKAADHDVTALDLAASGINPKQVLDVPHVSDYFRPLTEFMASLQDHQKIILVGHSLGGWAIAQAMEMFPDKIAVAVFVTAAMPGPTLNVSTISQQRGGSMDMLDNRYTYDNGPNNPPTTFVFGPKYLASEVYQLSPIEDLALATTSLRPVYLYTIDDASKEIVLSSERYGLVRRVFIIAEKDKLGTKDFQKWMIEHNPPNEVKEIKGADHMVMMSKPIELFVALETIAQESGPFLKN